jgi:glutamate dehydrogenase/leucine dehydrogenase
MLRAYNAAASLVKNSDRTFREAAYEIGVERVARAADLRGFVV